MKSIVTIILIFGCFFSVAQNKKGQKVKIEHADELEGGRVNGQEVRKLRGNVIFSQDNSKMYCDSAYQYTKSGFIEAFGKVKIEQGDSITIVGDHLTYDANSKVAKMRDNVVMKDKTMTLYTDFLNYDMNSKTAYYYNGGKLIDRGTTLTSTRGKYHSPSKTLFFKDSVHLVSNKYKVWCDTLNYNTVSKNAYFLGPTDIVSDGTKLFAKKGKYNTSTGESQFENQAAINDSTYRLMGDSIHYDQKLKRGFAKGNVEFYLKKDNIIIYGETGMTDDISGISKIFGKGTLMKNLMDKDTVYLKADTLLSIKDTSNNITNLSAWNNVELYKSDLQASCDSLSYNYIDSTISLFTEPILWSEESQMTGEFIKIQLKNDEVDRMFIDEDAFVVSEDEFKNYNQVKGKNMIGFFNDGKIKLLDVKGNGQSVYFVLEGDSVFTGMNKTLCTDMKFYFDSSQVKRIRFVTNPEAQFIPPKELKNPDKFLPGYDWLIDKRPVLESMLLSTESSPHLLLKAPEEIKLTEQGTKDD